MKSSNEVIRQAIRQIVIRDPGLAGILLWCPCETVESPDRPCFAYTNGKTIYLPPRFFELNTPEQRAVMVHEACHIAFCHAHRAEKLRRRDGAQFDHRLFNFAADLIINAAIEEIGEEAYWLALPEGVVKAGDPSVKPLFEKAPAHIWTVEDLYRELKKHSVEIPIPFVGDLKDVQEGGGDLAEESAGVWSLRLKRAVQGAEPGSFLRKLTAEATPPRVDWVSVLRNFVASHVMPTTVKTWSRPGRRTLAAGAGAQTLDPGIERESGPRRLGVVVDTSGSIEDEILKVFCTEINSLLAKTGAEMVLVAADAAVAQPVALIRHRIPAAFQFKGGGGTDFRPALEEMEEHQVDCCVYFTDLMGTFPEKRPSFPLLWAATKDGDVPFGRRVRVKV